MTGAAAARSAAPRTTPADPAAERTARRRHPTARPWRTDPERLRRRLAALLVAQGHSLAAAEVQSIAAALEAARRRPPGRRPA